MAEDLIVTMGDLRRAGICAAGARRWFPLHGFDFRDFLKNGIAAERLLATDDPFARRAVEEARKRVSNG